MLVAVDLGNSAIKLGAFEDGRLVATERVEGGIDVLDGVIPFPFVSTAEHVVVAASRPERVDDFRALAGRPVRVLGEDVQRAVRSPYEDPTELGVDRIASVWGAAALPEGAAVVVDAGTATTVDAIREDRWVAPLAIGPGLQSAAQGLVDRAPHLPRPAVDAGDLEIPARGTAASLRTGFALGFAGLVDRLVDAALHLVPGATVFLTGGCARALRPHLRHPHRAEDDLVLHGVMALHREFPA